MEPEPMEPEPMEPEPIEPEPMEPEPIEPEPMKPEPRLQLPALQPPALQPPASPGMQPSMEHLPEPEAEPAPGSLPEPEPEPQPVPKVEGSPVQGGPVQGGPVEGPSATEKARWAAALVAADADKDGVVSLGEGARFFKKRWAASARVTAATLKAAWKLCDVARKGHLTADEFLVACQLVERVAESAGAAAAFMHSEEIRQTWMPHDVLRQSRYEEMTAQMA